MIFELAIDALKICRPKQNIAEFQKLDPKTISKLMAVQKDSVDFLCKSLKDETKGEDLFYPSTKIELEQCAKNGFIIGAFVEQKIVAYAAAIDSNFKQTPYSSFAQKKTFGKCLDFEEIVVLNEFRGNYLQKILTAIVFFAAKDLGFEHVLCSVSPKNQHSMNNFLSVGFKNVVQTKMYNQQIRNIMAIQTNQQIIINNK